MAPSVAVVGGGITGLSAAFHLARNLPPSARILLFERSNRAGGWLRSSPIAESKAHSAFTLESGPRTLRPNSLPVMELVGMLVTHGICEGHTRTILLLAV